LVDAFGWRRLPSEVDALFQGSSRAFIVAMGFCGASDILKQKQRFETSSRFEGEGGACFHGTVILVANVGGPFGEGDP
jgi:hypothetical protein